MEARVETLLRVLKTVRPAYQTFYASLDNAQKLRVDALGLDVTVAMVVERVLHSEVHLEAFQADAGGSLVALR